MIDGDIAGMARKLVATQRQGAEHQEETAYRSLCEGLPVLLRTAGLARTVMFLAAKKKSGAEYAAVLDHMQMQLHEAGVCGDMKKSDLEVWVTSTGRNAAEYRHVSTFAFRVAYWHKRLAQALLRKKGEQ